MRVLLVETEASDAAADAPALAEDGNVVFRCFPESGSSDQRSDALRCVGVTEGACPLDDGVDVAVMRIAGPYPTIRAAGSLCALRRGVPVAEVRAEQDVVALAHEAIEDGYDELRSEIRWRLAPLLSGLEVRGDAIDIEFETVGPALFVTLRGPALPSAARQRIASRVADAIASSKRVFSKTDVAYVA